MHAKVLVLRGRGRVDPGRSLGLSFNRAFTDSTTAGEVETPRGDETAWGIGRFAGM
jgi:hypothetical protein